MDIFINDNIDLDPHNFSSIRLTKSENPKIMSIALNVIVIAFFIKNMNSAHKN